MWPVCRLGQICLMLLIWPVTSAADVSESIRYKYYTAEHLPPASLRAALNAVSPIRHGGLVFHGYTQWTVTWNFRWWEEADGRCRLTENQTTMAASITLPRLHSSDALAKATFDRYLSALHGHELEHVKIARQAAARIDEGIRHLPAMNSCHALEAAANQLGNLILQEAVTAEKLMDKTTGHGSVQGAMLP